MLTRGLEKDVGKLVLEPRLERALMPVCLKILSISEAMSSLAF